MKGYTSAITAAITAAGLFASTVLAADLPPIVSKGSRFFNSQTGEQFFIKGVAYQSDYTGGGAGSTGSGSSDNGQTYVDNLAIPADCARDIPYLKKLDTNTIRVYAINPQSDHDDCMSQLADAGIYVFADLAAPVEGESINQDDPAWNDELYARYTSVVDAMSKYTNVIGFFAGNEVSNAPNNTNTMPYVKAAVRDVKAYIKNTVSRPIYVGYAADDDMSIRVPVSEFMVCGEADDAVDFWGYNIYEWCGVSSFQQSGYAARTQEFSSYAKPAFFAEYGCNDVPRLFDDTPVLLGPQMDQTWSGGVVYMYFQTPNNYGLVNIVDNQVSTLPAFNSYSVQIAKASPTGPVMSDYTPTNTPWACPSEGSDWEAVATPLPPTPNAQACACMYNSLGCVVKSGVAPTAYGKEFGYVCGIKNTNYCGGIASNGTTGDYGAWSMCSAEQQLAYVFNEYAKAQSDSASACSFGGNAQTQSAQSPSGSCSSLLAQAGSAGTGIVTTAPSGTGNASPDGSSTTSSPANPRFASHTTTGLLPAAVMVTLACISGMGMIFL